MTVETTVGAIVRTGVGLVCFVAGLGGAVYQIEHPPISHGVVYAFIGISLFGALLLPSIFDVAYPRVQKIFALAFPNGLP